MSKKNMIERELILEKREYKKRQIMYLRDFLETILKGSNNKHRIDQELVTLHREVKLLDWILDDEDSPF